MRGALENSPRTVPQRQVLSHCPVCHGDRFKPRWEVNGYAIVACCGCSLVFVQNLPAREVLDSHYSVAGDEAYSDDNSGCLSYYYEKLRILIESRFPRRGKVLDVGCSRGWFLDIMKGWECHGNEIVMADAAIARQRHGDNIAEGRFEDYPLRDGYFDVITLQDVFDHFPDPVAVLLKCRQMLRPGGGIVIKVHNISCLYAKLSGKSFYAIIPPSHLFYYEEFTLSRILSNAGFRTADSRFIGHPLKLKTTFVRLSKSDPNSLLYRLSRALDESAIGNLKFRKNLHDIITVFALKSNAPDKPAWAESDAN